MNQVRSLLGSWGREAKEPVTLRLAELAVLGIQRTLGMLSAISKTNFLGKSFSSELSEYRYCLYSLDKPNGGIL